ncbi:MAG: KpsF/GutQ family sugar-phosphate isomerase [Prevotellaceae bacterium]|nr:KpsF/GutQ family sugar-phosphate isomerase [Candidatus Minthosoma equi]
MCSLLETKIFAENCLRQEAQALLDLIPCLDSNFDKVVELLHRCKGHVVVTGVGKSGHVAAKIAATLASTGTPAFFLNALDALHGDLGMLVPEDVLVFISNSGNTDELLRIIAAVEDRHIPIVSMTGNSESLIAQNSNYHILVKVEKEACPLNLAPTSSTTAAMAMGDALACALMEIRKFKAKDFAQFHPGGSIGRKLVVKVKDVMYTDNFPIVPPNMLLSEALIIISGGKLGLGIVMDGDDILGIITDGDIRRAVEGARENFLNLSVSDAMTRTPKTISPEAKLTTIQQMFRRHKIHSLLVVERGKLVGIVDYFAIMN